MPTSLTKSRLLRFVLAVIGLGYLSNLLTYPACRRVTEAWADSRLASSPSPLKSRIVSIAQFMVRLNCAVER